MSITIICDSSGDNFQSDGVVEQTLSCPPKSKMTKPFLKYVGGKTKLLPEILKRVPAEYENYYEPFVGGGAVFFALQPKGEVVLSDINKELINAYRSVAYGFDSLCKHLQTHVNTSEHYYAVRESQLMVGDYGPDFRMHNTEKAAKFIYLNKTCFNGLYRVNSKGKFNVPFGKYANPNFTDYDTLKSCHDALWKPRTLTLAAKPFKDIFFLDTISSKHFCYFDPPYVPITQTSFTAYDGSGFGLPEQIELRDLCVKLHERGAKWMLSNSSAPIVFDLYKDFKIEIVQMPRNVNSKGTGRGKVDEVLITNY